AEPTAMARLTAEEAQSPPSENDGGERPVRKQLKETTIESAPLPLKAQTEENGGNSRSSSQRRKRSFEESRDDNDEAAGSSPNSSPNARRKRSRDCTPENSEPSKIAKNKGAQSSADNPKVSSRDPRRRPKVAASPPQRHPPPVSRIKYPLLPCNYILPQTRAFGLEDDGSPAPSWAFSPLSDELPIQESIETDDDDYANTISQAAPVGESDDDDTELPEANNPNVSANFPSSSHQIPGFNVDDLNAVDAPSGNPVNAAEGSPARSGKSTPASSVESENSVNPEVPGFVRGFELGFFLSTFLFTARVELSDQQRYEAFAYWISGLVANSWALYPDPSSGPVIPTRVVPAPVTPEPRGANEESLQTSWATDDEGDEPIVKEESASPLCARPASEESPCGFWPKYRPLEDAGIESLSTYVPTMVDENTEERNMPSEPAGAVIPSGHPSATAPSGDTLSPYQKSITQFITSSEREDSEFRREFSEPVLYDYYDNYANLLSQDPAIDPEAPTNPNPTRPKKKRSREQLEKDRSTRCDNGTSTTDDLPKTAPAGEKPASGEEPEKKKHRDNSQERDTAATNNAFAASAFGNISSTSPFAALGSAKPKTTTEEQPASTSAFASSSLAGFASSAQSPFGSLGASSSSVFKPTDSTPKGGLASPSKTSGFGGLGSGFSGVGGGFGAAAKPGGLTSFASPNAPTTFGESKAKAFGAEESEDDETGNDEDEDEPTAGAFEEEKTDERFFQQTIETGEEEEENLFACKAKLFHFSDKEWKERGIGTFKINTKKDSDGKLGARMIMRADGAFRVMLNSPVFKGMNFGDAEGAEPASKQILLASLEEGRTVPLLLRVSEIISLVVLTVVLILHTDWKRVLHQGAL
ncbi:hypothetical protein N7474_010947, partial [Penicillium riverlandense]|uniref:uncharacterized protein n=1 Tax=Penicillium riverlandense TaxID=1903569 RepID=UPI002549756F